MVGLVINKMSFENKKGETIEGVNLTLKGDNGFYISKTFSKNGSKIKFYAVPHNVYTSIKIGGVYNFTFKTDSDTGYAVVDGCKQSSFED